MKHINESIIGRRGVSYQKYELTGETIETNDGHTLHRIKALKNIPSKKVKEGDLGGWIESYDNLDQKGDCWVGDEARVWGNAEVFDDAWVWKYAWIWGDAQVYGDARVYGDAGIYDNAKVYGNARIYDDARVFENAKVYGDAQVYGDAHVYGTSKVNYSINRGTVNK